MKHFNYLLAAYSVIFVTIFLYVGFIRTRQSRLEEALRAMETKLAALENELAQRASAPPH
ncbi:MAG TPA: CcmD family protein [Candidatus Binataceae bacterium]|nr:CcmD family protein [Candidatus Binataceae bacterium]